MPKTKTILIIIVLVVFSSATLIFYLEITSLGTETSSSNFMTNDIASFPLDTTNIEEEFHKRGELVQDICKKYHLGKYSYPNRSNDIQIKDSPTPQFSYFFINKKQNLAWCPVYKAGSTSWLHNMMILAGFSEETISSPPKQLSIWARDVYGEGEPGPIFDKAVKLVIVRHPFTRLISAFRDKLSNASIGLEHGTAHFYDKYGSKIVANFRSKNSPLIQKEPTFIEFVDYLLKTNFVYYDDHWLPVYYACTPCRVNYNYIAKVETFQRDQEFIIQGENLIAQLKPKWKHRTSNKKLGLDSEESRHYFSFLTKSQVYKLFNKYRMDFELFGYEFKEYLLYASDY